MVSGILGIDVGAPPLPEKETRIEFINRYAEDSGKRTEALKEKDNDWWAEEVKFFEFNKSRAWIVTRRIALPHTTEASRQSCLEFWDGIFTAFMALQLIPVDCNRITH